MASLNLLIFSLLLILTTTTTTTATTQESPQQPQFNAIIDSIVSTGDFTNWANLLSRADPSIFPPSATFFVPNDEAFLAANANFDHVLLPYHVTPRRYALADLLLLPIGARLPTLLPGTTLVITNNSAANFTVNGAALSHADLFQNDVVAVHGLSSVLDCCTISGEQRNATALQEPEPFSERKLSEEEIVTESPESAAIEEDQRWPVMEMRRGIFTLDEGEVVFLLLVLYVVLYD